MEIKQFTRPRKTRRYKLRKCVVCGRWIKAAGYGWVSHGRKHVREGRAKEIKGGRIIFQKVLRKTMPGLGKRFTPMAPQMAKAGRSK